MAAWQGGEDLAGVVQAHGARLDLQGGNWGRGGLCTLHQLLLVDSHEGQQKLAMANARLAEANKTAYQEGNKDGQAGVTQAVRSMLSGVGMKLVPIGSPGAGLMAPPQAMIELPPPPAAAAAGGLVPQQDVAVPPVAPAAGAAGGLVPPQDNQDAPAAAAAGAAAGAAGGLVPRRQRGGAPVADGAAELGEGAAGAANAGTRSGVVSLAAIGAQGRRDQRVTGSPASAKGRMGGKVKGGGGRGG